MTKVVVAAKLCQPTVETVGTGTDGHATVLTVYPSDLRYFSNKTVKTVAQSIIPVETHGFNLELA